ncbi:hypothetical protein IPC1233_23635 [Pseudomonas aeruginosa]|uniref:hypothetical protein n=1 Tax=Pseudomonas aeruginosa TaxID=287 RepID=UPI000FCABCD0|nr:hypothetical protein [Pseudomonas aeruginosa]RPN83034.1 hypothetical protein IPC1233_23635 [Pseudomonas aeruginosa]RUE00331.1 hypothetical protein IPC1234_24835 [Pseudomonas aeruginosa]
MNKANECTCPSGDGSLVHPCPAHPAVEQAGGDRWDALQSIMEWTAAKNIPDDRKLCLIRNAARAALAQPSPVRSSLLINGYQLRAALDFIAPDGTAEQLESEACIEWRQQDADFLEAGLYAFCAEYPEEGGVLLDEEPTTAQPSPLQSEQAEAERPEVAEVAFVLRNIGAMDAEDIDGDNVDLRFEDAEGRDTGCDVSIVEYAEKAADLFEQHDRIVGELRADRDSWAEQAEQRLADWDEMRKERDAALARVAELTATRNRYGLDAHYFNKNLQRILRDFESFTPDELARSLIILAKVADEKVVAQAQHSVPEGWMLVECGIWTQEQVDEMQKTVARFRNSEFVDDRALAMAVADAGQCKAPEISLAELLAAAPGKEGL